MSGSEESLSIWQNRYPVRTDEVGSDNRLEPGHLLRYLQDAAAQHADQMGFSVLSLQKEGRAWVLSRLRLKMERFPAWRDLITVQTWASGLDRLFAYRDYLVLSTQGQTLGRADSSWVLMDLESRRPVRMPEGFERFVVSDLTRSIPGRPGRLPISCLSEMKRSTILVLPEDTDFNQHVNHARYVEWMLERSREGSSRHLLSGLNVEFRSEAAVGDQLSLETGLVGDGPKGGHLLRRVTDRRRIALAVSEWTPAAE
jgi:acyl-ACP thioesterase